MWFHFFFQDNEDTTVSYEDRTLRFFPPAPRVPRMPGVVSGDSTLTDNTEDSFQDLLNTSHQRFNILCSADKDGGVFFSIFGIFPIGKIVSNLKTFRNVLILIARFVDVPFTFRIVDTIWYKNFNCG